MTRDKLFEANRLSEEIDRTNDTIRYLEAKISGYSFEPPTRSSGLVLSCNSEVKAFFNEAEVKLICEALKTRLEELSKEFESL